MDPLQLLGACRSQRKGLNAVTQGRTVVAQVQLPAALLLRITQRAPDTRWVRLLGVKLDRGGSIRCGHRRGSGCRRGSYHDSRAWGGSGGWVMYGRAAWWLRS